VPATPERNVSFDINDFDETLPAPCEWDVKRLAASIAPAARSLSLSDSKGRDCAVAMTRSYRKQIRRCSGMNPLRVWYEQVTSEDVIDMLPGAEQNVVRKRIDKAPSGTGPDLDFPKLTEAVAGRVRIREQPPLIFHPEITRSEEFDETLAGIFNDYRATLPEDRRTILDRFRIVDAAIKVVGVGSVGRRCWILLLMSESNDPLFQPFKEAVASVLEPFAGASLHAHHGQRVVVGQRMMQPASDIFLGWVTAPNGRQFYVRQMREAKMKPLVETFDAELLEIYAEALAGCSPAPMPRHPRSG
jgi:uncharacterized protein (DUF2252 family)